MQSLFRNIKIVKERNNAKETPLKENYDISLSIQKKITEPSDSSTDNEAKAAYEKQTEQLNSYRDAMIPRSGATKDDIERKLKEGEKLSTAIPKGANADTIKANLKEGNKLSTANTTRSMSKKIKSAIPGRNRSFKDEKGSYVDYDFDSASQKQDAAPRRPSTSTPPKHDSTAQMEQMLHEHPPQRPVSAPAPARPTTTITSQLPPQRPVSAPAAPQRPAANTPATQRPQATAITQPAVPQRPASTPITPSRPGTIAPIDIDQAHATFTQAPSAKTREQELHEYLTKNLETYKQLAAKAYPNPDDQAGNKKLIEIAENIDKFQKQLDACEKMTNPVKKSEQLHLIEEQIRENLIEIQTIIKLNKEKEARSEHPKS